MQMQASLAGGAMPFAKLAHGSENLPAWVRPLCTFEPNNRPAHAVVKMAKEGAL